MTKLNKATTILCLAAAAAVLAGCKSDDKDARKREESANKSFYEKNDKTTNNFFREEQGADTVNKFAEVQTSNGARNDAMLYPHHFSAGHLNSLGRQKVLLMLEDCDACEPLTVHLVNCGEGDVLAQRKAAVELYLKSTEGYNVETMHPAQPELIRFRKTEAGKVEEASSSDNAGGVGSPMSQGSVLK